MYRPCVYRLSRRVGAGFPKPAMPVAVNYTGEWGGYFAVTSCMDLTSLRFCEFSVAQESRGQFEWIYLNLTQTGNRVVGRMQTRCCGGSVTGLVNELGQLQLEGTLPLVKGPPSFKIENWLALLDPASRRLWGTFQTRYVNTSDPTGQARAITECEIRGIHPCRAVQSILECL